jgi:outer membrane protein TolC
MIPRARRGLPQKRGQQSPAGAALFTLTLVVVTVLRLASPAAAETIEQALARAYTNNPQLNAQRAIVRQADEGVPQALSGYRPNVSANASVGREYIPRYKAGHSADPAIPDDQRIICGQGAEHSTLGRRHR